MSSRCLEAAAIAALLALPAGADTRELRVCADPDNLPYSHRDETGFENRIARVIAGELGATLAYDWMPQRRGFVRKTMGAGRCDLFIGVPDGFERVLTTRPYYRSSYVLVHRDEADPIRSLDDARLLSMRIGVQLVGDDLDATPAGHALAARGAIRNVSGFTPYGDRPAVQRIVAELESGRLDAALVWGPQGAFFASRSREPLRVTVLPSPDPVALPFEFAIAMGVRKGDKALRDEVDEAISKRRGDIDAILARYGVPRTDR